MITQLIDRFITTPLVGIDLGSSVLKVVEVTRAEGRVTLRRCAVGELEGEDATKLLKRLLSRVGITTSHVVLGIASPEVIVRPFQFPPMPKKELSHAIQLEAEQAVLNGHALEEMAVDWHLFESSSRESVRGLLAVVPKSLLASHLQWARNTGLRPTVVDVEGLALWNAYWALRGSRDVAPKTILLVNIGKSKTNFVIAKGPDDLILVRDLHLGGQAISKGQEKEWALEVHDSLAYARSHGLRMLDAVYVTGGGSRQDLKMLLESAVAAPVEFWNPLKNIARGPGLSVEESVGPLLAIAIGLALRQPT